MTNDDAEGAEGVGRIQEGQGGLAMTRRKGGGRYWLTPPELNHLREERWDPTPYPHEFGDPNALLGPWKKPW